MPASSAQQVRRILADMVHQRPDPSAPPSDPSKPKYIWQVRHSGLLGLKYVVAVQGRELLSIPPMVKVEEDVKPNLLNAEMPLKQVVDAALVGLRDRDDDVRAAAAATLAPVTHEIVAGLPSELHDLLEVLWSCLSDLKDDLASSVGGVMNLLCVYLSVCLRIRVISLICCSPQRNCSSTRRFWHICNRRPCRKWFSIGPSSDDELTRPFARSGLLFLFSFPASSLSSDTRSHPSGSRSCEPSSSSCGYRLFLRPGSTPLSVDSSFRTCFSRSAPRFARRHSKRGRPVSGAWEHQYRRSSLRRSTTGSPSSTRRSAPLSTVACCHSVRREILRRKERCTAWTSRCSTRISLSSPPNRSYAAALPPRPLSVPSCPRGRESSQTISTIRSRAACSPRQHCSEHSPLSSSKNGPRGPWTRLHSQPLP